MNNDLQNCIKCKTQIKPDDNTGLSNIFICKKCFISLFKKKIRRKEGLICFLNDDNCNKTECQYYKICSTGNI